MQHKQFLRLIVLCTSSFTQFAGSTVGAGIAKGISYNYNWYASNGGARMLDQEYTPGQAFWGEVGQSIGVSSCG